MFSPEGYRALTEAAAVVRRGDRGVLAVTGADRLSWLQGLVTNDVAALPIGGICDAAYLTPQGRMITDLRVAHQAERTLLDVPASLSEALHKRLDALLFSEDAQIADVSATTAIIEVHGPRAAPIVEGESFVRDDPFELPGFTAFVPVADAPALVARLVDRGAAEATLETLDVVRVEAGRPAFLMDLDEHTIPLEAGLDRRAISFTKGCYVGQEVIVRITHRGGGRVARRLVGLRVHASDLPKRGDVIVSNGREVGKVTSAVRSPALAMPIALGFVHRDFAEPGTAVELTSTAASLPAEVSSLPFIPLALRLQTSAP